MESNSTNKTIVMLDASAIKRSACHLALYNTCVEGIRPKILLNDIEYGSAFHVFPQVLAETGSTTKAFEEAQQYFLSKSVDRRFVVKKNKEWLNVAHLTITCEDFLKKFGNYSMGDFEALVVDGKPLVEKNFALKIYEGESIIVMLTGTIDITGKLRQGCYAICDYKTTASYEKEEYLESYAMSPQLMVYLLAIRILAERYPESIFAEMRGQRIGAFILGVFLSKTLPTDFKRSRVFFFNDEDLDGMLAYIHNLCRTLDGMHSIPEHRPKMGMFNDQCYGKFNKPCEFLALCKAPDKFAREQLLNTQYNITPYNPLDFRKHDLNNNPTKAE